MRLLGWLGMIPSVLLGVGVKSLKDASTVPLHSLLNPPALVVIFQADCHSCRKQVQSIKCFESDFRIHLLGVVSSEIALRSEYVRMKVSYPAYHGSQDVLKALKWPVHATPTTVALTPGNTTFSYGYLECEQLKSQLTQSATPKKNKGFEDP